VKTIGRTDGYPGRDWYSLAHNTNVALDLRRKRGRSRNLKESIGQGHFAS
jgi:hypothetical protein